MCAIEKYIRGRSFDMAPLNEYIRDAISMNVEGCLFHVRKRIDFASSEQSHFINIRSHDSRHRQELSAQRVERFRLKENGAGGGMYNGIDHQVSDSMLAKPGRHDLDDLRVT